MSNILHLLMAYSFVKVRPYVGQVSYMLLTSLNNCTSDIQMLKPYQAPMTQF